MWDLKDEIVGAFFSALGRLFQSFRAAIEKAPASRENGSPTFSGEDILGSEFVDVVVGVAGWGVVGGDVSSVVFFDVEATPHALLPFPHHCLEVPHHSLPLPLLVVIVVFDFRVPAPDRTRYGALHLFHAFPAPAFPRGALGEFVRPLGVVHLSLFRLLVGPGLRGFGKLGVAFQWRGAVQVAVIVVDFQT